MTKLMSQCQQQRHLRCQPPKGFRAIKEGHLLGLREVQGRQGCLTLGTKVSVTNRTQALLL